MSEQVISQVQAAFVRASKNIKNPTKDSTNPFLKNKYASLGTVIDCVREPLASEGLHLAQEAVVTGDGKFLSVLTHIMHVSGGELLFTVDVPIPASAKPQDVMGAFTYGRRYGLLAVFNLAAEDDDGNQASGLDNLSAPVTVASNATGLKNILGKKA